MALYNRSIGKKLVMAFTGTILVLFIFAHLAGNLTIFSGSQTLNTYASFLKSLGVAIWVSRLVLLACVLTHAVVGFLLWRENRAARPVGYLGGQTYQASTFSSRTMIFSGLILGAFIIFHVSHFTLGLIHPQIALETVGQGREELYDYVVRSFQYVGTVLVYTAGICALFLHIRHGFSSLFQSFGLNTERLLPKLAVLSTVLAVLLLAGYLSIPFSALLNIISV